MIKVVLCVLLAHCGDVDLILIVVGLVSLLGEMCKSPVTVSEITMITAAIAALPSALGCLLIL